MPFWRSGILAIFLFFFVFDFCFNNLNDYFTKQGLPKIKPGSYIAVNGEGTAGREMQPNTTCILARLFNMGLTYPSLWYRPGVRAYARYGCRIPPLAPGQSAAGQVLELARVSALKCVGSLPDPVVLCGTTVCCIVQVEMRMEVTEAMDSSSFSSSSGS